MIIVDDVSTSIYTQISDVELECDGFLNYDRTSIFFTFIIFVLLSVTNNIQIQLSPSAKHLQCQPSTD